MNADSFYFLSKHLLQDLHAINDALAVVGIFYCSSKFVKVIITLGDFVKAHIISRYGSRDFIKLYGGKWAVVTGSSDGIGRAYAEELAQRGMNLILISRDVRKLQDTAIELNEKYEVEVDFVSLTFDGDQSKYSQLSEVLGDRDIGILVNNVGVMYDYPNYFMQIPSERLWELFNVNIAATTMMTYLVLPQMVERGKGAIVNMSAGGCTRPSPQMAVYAATKAYVNLFSRALHYEYKSRGITVQCLTPLYVATRMQRFSKTLSKPTVHIPSAEKYAKHAIQTLGYSHQTTGYWAHTIQSWIAWLIPEPMWMWAASRLNTALRRQAQERLRSRSFRNMTDLDNAS